jgi:hypothetical protein
MRVMAIGVLLQATAAAQTESCNPADASSANVRVDDAGQVWVGDLPLQSPDVPFDPSSVRGPMKPPPPPLPQLQELCKLVRGNLTGKGTVPEGWQGMWIGDVTADYVLGRPNGITRTTGTGATLSYTFLKPGVVTPIGMDPETVQLTAQFEWVAAFSGRQGTKLVPLTDPYFLTEVDLQTIGGTPSPTFDRLAEDARACWNQTLKWAQGSEFKPCPECLARDQGFWLCSDLGLEHVEDCFKEEFTD